MTKNRNNIPARVHSRLSRLLPAVLSLGLVLGGCSASSGSNSTETSRENPVSDSGNNTEDQEAGSDQSTDQTDESNKEEGSKEKESESFETITFVDDMDREVTLEKPERVATMIGSFADMWVTAGGADSLVAAAHDTWTSFDLPLHDDVADLGEIKSPSLETLIASQPDLVLASAKNDSNKELEETLSQAGIPVAYFDVSSFDDYLRMLDILCQLTGDEEAFAANGTDLADRIETVKNMASEQTPENVLYIRATGSSVKAKNSEGSVLGEMLADLNASNIADSDSGLLEDLSMEAILQADPDKILIVYQGSDDSRAKANMEETLTGNPAWQSLSAVKNGEVYVLDQTLYNLKPNARWADAYEQLYTVLYE